MIPQNSVYLSGQLKILSNEKYKRKQNSHTAKSFFGIKPDMPHWFIFYL